ncbi:unnamed protein product, partial [Mycena citricolor]
MQNKDNYVTRIIRLSRTARVPPQSQPVTTTMRLLLPLLSLSTALAFPTGDQVVLNLGTASASSGEAYHAANLWLDDTKKAILEGKKNMEKWFHAGKEFIKQNGMLYELVSHPSLAEHQLRVTEPDLCDSSVKQYSGYVRSLDILLVRRLT